MVVINILNKVDVKPLTTTTKICMCLLSSVFSILWHAKKISREIFQIQNSAAVQDLFSLLIFRKIVSFKRFNERHYRSLVQRFHRPCDTYNK